MSDLRDFIMQHPLFDSHEHQSENGWEWDTLDHTAFWGYLGQDMGNATLPNSEAMSDAQKWDAASTTGYGQAVDMGCRTLLNMPYDIRQAEAITDALQAWLHERRGTDIHRHIFKEQIGCTAVIADINDDLLTPPETLTNPHVPDYIHFALRLGRRGWFANGDRAEVQELEKRLNTSLQTLDEMEKAIGRYLDQIHATGKLSSLKIGIAYIRPLDVQGQVNRTEASRCYDAFLRGKNPNLRPLHDHLIHIQLRWADAHKMPVQIHTGYLAGLNKDIRFGDPSPLIPLILNYPNVTFDLFHSSWPWTGIAAAIAKQCPNVCLDLCWAWALSPAETERTLDDWLGSLPHNKIIGFGGDCWTPFASLGYAQQARTGIANCLEKKVQRGEYSQQTAEAVARSLLSENGHRIFNIQKTDVIKLATKDAEK